MSGDGSQPDTVSVAAIGLAPVERPRAEAAAPNTNPLTGKDEKLGQHLGVVGRFVGGGPEKAGNIASIVIFASLALLIGGLIVSGTLPDGSKLAPVIDKLIAGAISLITGALGFLFGASRESK